MIKRYKRKGHIDSAADKLAFANCFMEYRDIEDYIDALEYTNERAKGRKAYNKGKRIYTALSLNFTDAEIYDLATAALYAPADLFDK
jgi:hypothetical protein